MKNYEFNEKVIEQKTILTFKEATDYLGISESSLYKLTSSCAITFYKPNGGKIYFKREDLDKWMLQNEVKSVTQREEELTAKFTGDGK